MGTKYVKDIIAFNFSYKPFFSFRLQKILIYDWLSDLWKSVRGFIGIPGWSWKNWIPKRVVTCSAPSTRPGHTVRYVDCGAVGLPHGLINLIDTKAKCRHLWRYSQSCWYFRPSFVNCCPSPLLCGSNHPCLNKYLYTVYTRIQCVRGSWHQTDKHLPQIFRWRHFALPSMSLIFLRAALEYQSDEFRKCGQIICKYLVSRYEVYFSSVLCGRRTELESLKIGEKVAENSPFWKAGFSPMFLNKVPLNRWSKQLLLRSKNRKQTEQWDCAVDCEKVTQQPQIKVF